MEIAVVFHKQCAAAQPGGIERMTGAVWSRNAKRRPCSPRLATRPDATSFVRALLSPRVGTQPSPRRIALRAPDPVVRPKASARQPVVGARSDLGTASQI